MPRLRVRHAFAVALVTIAACDEIGEPIDAEVYISENPPSPDAAIDATPAPPDASHAAVVDPQ